MTTGVVEVFNRFGRTFVLTDPGYVKGLEIFRDVNAVPERRDITGLGAILPIIANTDKQNQSVKVSFSITELINVTNNGKSEAFNLLQQPAHELAGFAPAAQTIKTVKPVQHVSKNGAAVLFFNIGSLSPVLIASAGNKYSSYGSRAKKTRISVKPYNKSSGANITSDPPMVDTVVGSTATFSFDITELPRI